MTPLSERMVEAAARAAYERSNKGLKNVWGWEDHGLDDEHPGTRERYLAIALAALTAALAVAEAEEVVLCKVPENVEPRFERHTIWCSGYTAAIAAILAGRVTL